MPHGREKGIGAHKSAADDGWLRLRIDGCLEKKCKVQASALKGALLCLGLGLHALSQASAARFILCSSSLFLRGIFEWFIIHSIFGARQD